MTINYEKIKSVKKLLSAEQLKSINFYRDIEYSKELLKPTKKLDFIVNVITTYEKEEQERFDVEIKDIYPSSACSMNTELEVLTKVLEDMKINSNRNLQHLAKISMCYMTDTITIDDEKFHTEFNTPLCKEEFLQDIKLLEVIKRCESKYYFQPNQRDIVVNAVLNEKTDVACLTKEHDSAEYVKSMLDAPRYLEGKSIVENINNTIVEIQKEVA